MMMSSEISEEFSNCSTDNHQLIVKRKRTKRLIKPSSSATTTSTTTTEEDEDMAANCLILLARGGGGGGPEEEEEIKHPSENNKLSSRKFTEMITTTSNGKIGIYVYECKTCNRSFPSFQALGGHRASHKKPRITTADNIDRKKPSPPPAAADDRGRFINSTTAKIHECLICGSEFGSGQALGGHMRRHRSAINNNNNNISARIGDNDTTSSHGVSEKSRNMLALDLNLPAPPEEEASFHPRLAFSAVKLVDCHY